MTIISIVIGALGSGTEVLVPRLEDLDTTGRVETIQITGLLRLTRILRSVLEEICCRSNFRGRPSTNTDVKTLKEQ